MTPRRIALFSLWFAAIAATLWWAYGQIGDRSVPNAQQSAQALIGGPFSLTDQSGETVTDQQFRGRYMLIYFGYTFCPDICPLEVAAMDRAFALLKDQGIDTSPVQPLFISVDPERDDVAALQAFVQQYEFDLIGLTGSTQQIEAVKNAYRVYAAKAQATADDAEFYLVDHSSVIYLMGPDGKFVRHFSYGTSAQEMASALANELRS
ncbi:MAG: SCO family protein [Sphingomonadales bacterium]